MYRILKKKRYVFYTIMSFYWSIIHVIIGCLDSYTVYDQSTKGEGIIHVDTQKEKQCKSLCNVNSVCQGFHHDTSDNTCELTVGNIATYSGSSGSRFYQRHCPKGNRFKYNVDWVYFIKTNKMFNQLFTKCKFQNSCLFLIPLYIFKFTYR